MPLTFHYHGTVFLHVSGEILCTEDYGLAIPQAALPFQTAIMVDI
jgi:hypothetical protein